MTNYIYIDSGADISADCKYRYKLWRQWSGTLDPADEPKSCLFVMLNPSTADATTDDRTIRRCVGFAKAWKYERLEVVNLFAFRTSNPGELRALHYSTDPVGPRNSEVISNAATRAGIIICAWGSNGVHMHQDKTVMGWLPDRCYALKLMADGHPWHPLYVRGDAKPFPFFVGEGGG